MRDALRSPGAVTRRLRLRHPAQLVTVAFAAAIAVGTLLLWLPVSRAGPGGADVLTALFTATSAICVTGHIVVDTPTYWSRFGQVVILGLVQLGGFGIMTLASLVALFLSRKLGLRRRVVAQAETGALDLGDVRRVLLGVAAWTAMFEATAMVVLSGRFWLGYDEPVLHAAWLGLFHSVTAYNNAGFALWSDNLTRFVADPWISITVGVTVIAGGIGFPVLNELRRNLRRPKRWSLHTKLVLFATGGLLLLGMAAVLAFEWSNPDTLAPLDVPGKLLASFFQSVTPRTAGFNTIDYAAVNDTTLLVTDALMFIGTGPASTGGGIKVTTFALLGFVIWSEVRGEQDVVLFGRRSPDAAQRQALSVALVGVATVVAGTFGMLLLSDLPLSVLLFEVFSAFGTVGLSTGITAGLHDGAKGILIVLMFLGRIGPTTFGAAVVLRERRRLYRYPEERTILG
jgi:potassium uptake TrkH family protein